MAASVPFGPGTITIGATPLDFTCEVLGGKVTHTYADVGDARTMLCGTKRPSSKDRTDGLAFEVENDLTAAGLYAYLMTNDLTEQDFDYTPNTANARRGPVRCAPSPARLARTVRLPDCVAVEWAGVGVFTLTPGAGVPPQPAPTPPDG